MTPRQWKITSLVCDAKSSTSQAINMVELWCSMKLMDRYDLLTAARQFRDAADWIEENVTRLESTPTSCPRSSDVAGADQTSLPA